MRSLYYRAFAALAFGALTVPAQAQTDFTTCPTDQAECVVEWAASDGFTPVVNALRNTIANDTDRPDDRVYVLLRGGLYWNEDTIENDGFDLRLRGESAEDATASEQQALCSLDDCGPALMQRRVRADNTVEAVMIRSGGDATGGQHLENIWLMGQDNTGVTANYEPIVITSTNSMFTYDNVVFDRNDWHHLGFKSGGNNIYVRNSKFRNLVGPTQRYEGRGIRLEAGADTVMFENNSFFNITSFPFQSESAPVEYFVFNHNTVINFGLTFNAGGIWKTALIANNVWTNPYYQGESADLYNQPNRVDPYTGVFTVGQLPLGTGFNADRRILLANNAWGLAQEIEDHFATFSPVVRAQPLVSDTTQGWFDRFDGMVIQNNIETIPNFVSAPTTAEVYGLIKDFVTDVSVPNTPTPFALVTWDPGRPDNPLANNWPLPEDFSYSDANLQSAGTDGLPLGDLNWFPAAKETYLDNRGEYIDALLAETGGTPVEPVISVIQSETGTIGDNASIVSVEGATFLSFDASGFIEWTFSVPADGEYGLNVTSDIRANTERGQRIYVDGVNLRNQANYGEYFFCSDTSTNADCVASDERLPIDGPGVVQIRTEDLIDVGDTDVDDTQALMLSAGTHTIRIEPSWGYQMFGQIEVVDAGGSVVTTLTPAMAMAAGPTEICPPETRFCSSGFQSVQLGAGGSVTYSVTVSENSAVQMFFTYLSENGASGDLLVDGTSVQSLDFAATSDSTTAIVSGPRGPLAAGEHTVTVTSSTGGVSLDFFQVAVYPGTGTNVEGLPEGWSLEHAFPNPTTDAASIRFTLAEAADVRLEVYDVLGRRVASLANGPMPAGTHLARLETAPLASGTYIYRLSTPVGAQTRRMTVVR